jgi:hypothetical protein
LGYLSQRPPSRNEREHTVIRKSIGMHPIDIPTECSLCGAADFSRLLEISLEGTGVMHWISPPSGWYLLREARLSRKTPLIHARCSTCLRQALRRHPGTAR